MSNGYYLVKLIRDHQGNVPLNKRLLMLLKSNIEFINIDYLVDFCDKKILIRDKNYYSILASFNENILVDIPNLTKIKIHFVIIRYVLTFFNKFKYIDFAIYQAREMCRSCIGLSGSSNLKSLKISDSFGVVDYDLPDSIERLYCLYGRYVQYKQIINKNLKYLHVTNIDNINFSLLPNLEKLVCLGKKDMTLPDVKYIFLRCSEKSIEYFLRPDFEVKTFYLELRSNNKKVILRKKD